jgi:hypothetical protein
MFQSMLLEELLRRKVQATIFINNKGAIFLVKNHKDSSMTKDIRLRHLYMRELQDRGRVKVELDLAEKFFNKHTNRGLEGRILECLREDVKMYGILEGKSLN